jgi:hypothetical protein
MIRKGDTVVIKPEWQDRNDHKFIWIAVEDEDGGRVAIMPTGTKTHLAYPPVDVVLVSMLATGEG